MVFSKQPDASDRDGRPASVSFRHKGVVCIKEVVRTSDRIRNADAFGVPFILLLFTDEVVNSREEILTNC